MIVSMASLGVFSSIRMLTVPPVVVTVPAPLGQPVVLYRVGDKQGAALRKVLQDRGLLR